jgi:hypothetical protein
MGRRDRPDRVRATESAARGGSAASGHRGHR